MEGEQSKIGVGKGQICHYDVKNCSKNNKFCRQWEVQRILCHTSGKDNSKGCLAWGWQASTSILLLVILGLQVFLLATKEDQHQQDLETTTTQTIDRECQGRQRFSTIYLMLHAGWILIQRRGQYGNPPDFFSSKLWDDYEQGFGEPEKGSILI